MRLLVVTQYFWPETFRINELVADLVCRGHEVTVLTGLPNYPDGMVFEEFRRAPGRFAEFEGCRVVRVPMLPRGRGAVRLMLNYLTFALAASLLGPWILRRERFDAILAYEPSPVTVGIPAAVMRAIKRVPMAFWVLDLWPETLKAVGVLRSKWLLWLVAKLVAWIYRRCDLLLAQSRSFIGSIGSHAPVSARVEYFPAWADDIFLEANYEPAPEVPAAAGAFTILFAGNMGEAQDFPAILDAAECLRDRDDIRWVLVGDGRMAHWITNQVEERGLAGRVLMVGRHPLARMPEFFAHADALLVSLKSDPVFAMTIPGKLQAYLGAGIPVIAMLDGEGADIVVDANAGLIGPAGDGETLASNVARMASMDRRDRQRLGENGRRYCAREFDRETLIDRLEGWLEGLTYPGSYRGTAQ